MTIISRDIGQLRSHGALQPISAGDMPAEHPVRILAERYAALHETCEGEHLPEFRALLQHAGLDLIDYCLVLSPIAAQPFIDFVIMRKGTRLPGAGLPDFKVGERYSQIILADHIDERLMELASCLALRQPRLTVALSARKSALNMKIYRAVFPVWDQSLLHYIALLAVAPVYASAGSRS